MQALRQQQKAEESALLAVIGASGTVEQARQRRAAEVEALDAAVSEAEAGEDVALAVLGALMPADRAGRLAGVSPARMQQALRRTAAETVAGKLETLTGGGAVAVRRRGRPRGSGAPRRVRRDGERADVSSATDDERHDQQERGDGGEGDADDGERPAASDDGAA